MTEFHKLWVKTVDFLVIAKFCLGSKFSAYLFRYQKKSFFLGLMEALMECNSTILVKLLPLWTPVMYAFHVQLPDHVKVRLQVIQDFKPPEIKGVIF